MADRESFGQDLRRPIRRGMSTISGQKGSLVGLRRGPTRRMTLSQEMVPPDQSCAHGRRDDPKGLAHDHAKPDERSREGIQDRIGHYYEGNDKDYWADASRMQEPENARRAKGERGGIEMGSQ